MRIRFRQYEDHDTAIGDRRAIWIYGTWRWHAILKKNAMLVKNPVPDDQDVDLRIKFVPDLS